MNPFKRTKSSVNLDELNQQADTADALVESNEPHVSALNAWLVWRTNKNGFGDDFEYSLKPRGTNS